MTPEARATLANEGDLVRATIRQAIQGKRQVMARKRGEPICFCPHALGERNGEAYALGFLLATDTADLAPRSWQWIRLADLREVALRRGVWLTAQRWSRPSVRFLDTVLVEVP